MFIELFFFYLKIRKQQINNKKTEPCIFQIVSKIHNAFLLNFDRNEDKTRSGKTAGEQI